jgi:hypothetical protein
MEMPIGDLDLQSIVEVASYESDESEDGLEELKGGECSDIATTETSLNLENQTEASNA